MVWTEADGIKGHIITYIPDNHFLRAGHKAAHLGPEVRGTKFSGIQMVSRLDGRLIEGYRYQNGKAKFAFRLRSDAACYPNRALMDSLNHKYKVHVALTAGSNLSRAYSSSEGSGGKCSFCNKDLYDCTCVEIVYCKGCRNPIDECTCCIVCGNDPCKCCYICGTYPCRCDYTVDPGDNGGSSEGGNNGGGTHPGGWESGGNGGNGGTKPPVVAPKAKAIFRNSNMTKTNWEIIERMIEKIINDCMGEALYEGLVDKLNGKTLTIQFNLGAAGTFGPQGESVGISLGKQESNQLLHEMFHAYQAYNEVPQSFNDSQLNREIEAHYAQYLYVKDLPEYERSRWEYKYNNSPRYRSTKDIQKYLDDKGKLRTSISSTKFDEYMKTLTTTFQAHGYTNQSYDEGRSLSQNFKNLKELTKDC